MKNVLMVCYYYPPLADVGCKRSVAFSKYLQDFGWKPHVMTVRNPDKDYCIFGSDHPPQGVQVSRVSSLLNPYRYLGKANGLLTRCLYLFGIKLKRNYLVDILCVPDIFLGWIPLAVFKGRKLIRENDIDVIYVSCSPFSAGIIGVLLKFLMKKPLVLDFRDPYALKRVGEFGVPSFRKKLNQSIESQMLKRADYFVVTCEETRKAYIDQYPWVSKKISTIYNGFDSDFMSDGPKVKFEKFTIIYAGNFYEYDPENRNYADAFFGALADLKERGEIDSSTFEFLYYGATKDLIEESAGKFGVLDLVSLHQSVPYSTIIKVIQRSHLHLLRIVKMMISTKLFDGISLDVPFLATIPEGEVEEIIKIYSPGSYVVCNPSSKHVADAIFDAKTRYEHGETPSNSVNKFLEKFSRKSLAMQLSDNVLTPLLPQKLE